MKRKTPGILLLPLLLSLVAAPALAGSSASSASSDGSSASSGSSSTSFEKSSDSSTTKTAMAEGDYRIARIDAAPQRPGALRMTLQAVPGSGAQGEFTLILPEQAVAKAALAQGDVVSARLRPYGVEFAQAATPFFLVLHDAWYDELRNTVVQI
jgi:hypothetical protein